MIAKLFGGGVGIRGCCVGDIASVAKNDLFA